MTSPLVITIPLDTATPTLRAIAALANSTTAQNKMAGACATLTRTHIAALGPNKNGWPSTGFYKEVASSGIKTQVASGSFTITIEHPRKPGAMAQRYYGGPIDAKDHLLSIPARAEFYGHSPTEFTNLRFVMFKSGAMAFVIGNRGVGRVNFETGTEHNVRGAGSRTAGMIAYWLTDHVDQKGNPDVIPSPGQYSTTCLDVLTSIVAQIVRNKGAN